MCTENLRALPLTDEFLEEFKNREMWLKVADAPAKYEYYQVNYDGQVYMPQQVMADRANFLFDKWENEVLATDICENTWTVGTSLTVKAVRFGEPLSITQYGVNKVTIRTGETAPVKDEMHQSIKSSISDALKKCLSWYGIFAHVYRGDVKSLKEGTKEYWHFVKTLELNASDFKYGIAMLPDYFKHYYEKNGWKGVFASDVAAFRSSGKGENGSQGQWSQQGRNQQGSQGQQRGQGSSTPRSGNGNNGQGRSKAYYVSPGQVNVITNISSEIKPGIQESEILEAVNRDLGTKYEGLSKIPNADFDKVFTYIKKKKSHANIA